MMLDPDTFLTQWYVTVDDVCHTLPPERRPGPAAALTRSEVVTLALFSQWNRFPNERQFYRWALRHLRAAFPGLPAHSQFNRLVRRYHDAIVAVSQWLAAQLDDPQHVYEALDGTGVPIRNVKRRGRGWLAGRADVGHSQRLGGYHGFHVLLAVRPHGAVTGHGLAPASTKEQPFAETFLAARHQPQAGLPSVGRASERYYLGDKGFQGRHLHTKWQECYGATVVAAPQRRTKEAPHPWPKPLRRWLAGLRQIVATVVDKLQAHFRLDEERPHALTGMQARLAAKIALHNFCLWLNARWRRPLLAFAELIDW